jgi:hypothetical protein
MMKLKFFVTKGGKDIMKLVKVRSVASMMFHFAGFTVKNATEASSYLVYADAFDPLFWDGWRVVLVTAPREPEANLPTSNREDDRILGNLANDGRC